MFCSCFCLIADLAVDAPECVESVVDSGIAVRILRIGGAGPNRQATLSFSLTHVSSKTVA